MEDSYSETLDAVRQARWSFFVAAVPYTGLLFLWLGLKLLVPAKDSGFGVYAGFGSLYVFGSLFALSGQLPLRPLVFVGLILNLLGMAVWLPGLMTRGLDLLSLTGLFLTFMWGRAVVAFYLEERR